MGEVVNAVEYITGIFKSLLKAKGMYLSSIQDEIEEVIEFPRKYLPISTRNYRIIYIHAVILISGPPYLFLVS